MPEYAVSEFDIKLVRAQFPALSRKYNGRELVFLDGPAGTQVPDGVIEAIAHYYKTCNANSHGQFITTHETDTVIDTARSKMAAFLGAENATTISFGANMTTLNFSLSKAIGRYLQPGDEILITQLDHEANRGPWLNLREQGIIVREINLLSSGVLDYDDFESKINERTRLVAVGYASNILGTVNDIARVRKVCYQYNTWLLIDAVHHAAHFSIDVQEVGCDFLLCSAYKFYGPHVGILYAKPGLLDRLNPDRLITQDQQAPNRIETGTFNHAALAGVSAAVDFIVSLGEGESERNKLAAAMASIQKKENQLARMLYNGLNNIDGIEVIGLNFDQSMRAPTLSFIIKGKTPTEVCRYLADHSICAWDGHFYAVRTVEVLGLAERGGVTRMGINAYNTAEEIGYTLEKLEGWVRQ